MGKNYQMYNVLSTILKTVDTFANFATTSISVKLAITAFVLIVMSLSSRIACGLLLLLKFLMKRQ